MTKRQQVPASITRRAGKPATREQLVMLLAELPPEHLAVAGIGVHLGMLWGIEQGIAAEQWAEECRWHRVFLTTRAVLDAEPLDVIAQRRVPDWQPCPSWCRACSRCIASIAYRARGGSPYGGVHQEVEPAAGGAP
jgi:hypothetical protein